jgi:putative peptidoglycan lipid II flippase
MNPKQQMLRSSGIVAFFNLLGGLSGILVETSIAANLGLSMRSDTFYVAYTIPYIISNLLTATSQFSLVPFFASLETNQDEKELWRGFSYVSNILFLGLGGIAVVGAAAAPWIIHGIAPGFTHQQDVLATQLARWLFFIIIPAGIGEVLRSFLLSRHYFALSTASGFIRNVTSVVVIIAGFHRYGPQSIFLGYMGGCLLQVVILGAQVLLSFRPRYSLTLSGSGKSFSNLRGAGSAQLGGALGWQGVVIVERIIASFLPAGTLTALNYGFRILGSISELLGGSVGTAALPVLSRAVAMGDHESEHKTFRDTLEISLLLLAPMAVFCLTLGHNIIRLAFQRGNFTPDATNLMSAVFFYYSLSLIFFALIRLLSFYLFARFEPGTYIRLALFQYALNIVFDLLFVGVFHWGAKGIPLGFLTGLVGTCALAYWRNLANLKDIVDPTLVTFTAKALIASLLAAAEMVGLRVIYGIPPTNVANFVYLCVMCSSGGLVFLATMALSGAIRKADFSILLRREGNA